MYFERLRELRKEKKLSQTDVGEYLGIMQTVYSRYERGYHTLTVEILLKLSELYGVSTDYILGLSNERYPGAAKHDEARAALDENEIESVVRRKRTFG